MRELRILKITRNLIKYIYSIKLPKSETYGLQSQMRRALASLNEVDECMKIVLALDYINSLEEFYLKYLHVLNSLVLLINSVTQVLKSSVTQVLNSHE